MQLYQNRLSIIIAHERIFTHGFIPFVLRSLSIVQGKSILL